VVVDAALVGPAVDFDSSAPLIAVLTLRRINVVDLDDEPGEPRYECVSSVERVRSHVEAESVIWRSQCQKDFALWRHFYLKLLA